MKKLAMVFMAAALLFTAGCGESEKVISGNGGNGNPDATQNGEATDGQESAEQEGDGEISVPEKGYVFTYNGATAVVDADAAPLVEALGEPLSYYEAASCAFDGLDKIYTYSGFEIETYPMGEKDQVSAVILKDDSVSTTEGISIGDSLEKLEQTYGTDRVEESGMLVYEKDGMKLCFIVQGDVIVSIEYRSTVLE